MKRYLTDVRYLRSRLNRAGIKPRRQAGQSFLICEEVVEATLLALQNGPKQVTELGAGGGTLTLALLEAGFKVKAIERDQALADVLASEVREAKRGELKLIRDDLREIDWSWAKEESQDEAYQLVGNIPYNLSGNIIRRVVQLEPKPTQIVLLVQQEVGDRLVAKPPDMGLMSLAVSLWGQADVLLRVPASCFWPQPKVESHLVLLVPKKDGPVGLAEQENVLSLARYFFQTRRKQVGGGLKKRVGPERAVELLKKAGIDPTSRPQELMVEQWRALARML